MPQQRRLTDRQLIVLAALERLEAANLLELRYELPDLAPSEVARVLASLERRGLVGSAGDPEQIYLGGVRFYLRGGEVEEEFEAVEQMREDTPELDPQARAALRRLVGIISATALIEIWLEGAGRGEHVEQAGDACEQIRHLASEWAGESGVPPSFEGLVE